MKRDIFYSIIIAILLYVIAFISSNKYDKEEELDVYKTYYNKAEKLFDRVEESNDEYFDLDEGQDYIKARENVKNLQ